MSQNIVSGTPSLRERKRWMLQSVNATNFISRAEFHDILKERKTERKRMAKEKCEVGRKRIEEMKSRDGVHPVQIFPSEIWEMILNELNHDEKGTMCELHKMFGKLMQSRQIQDILLPKMIDSEVMKFNDNQNIDPPATYATLRSISKSIRDAVDNHHENNLLKFLRYEIAQKFLPTTLPKMKIDLVLGGDAEGEGMRENKILKHFLDKAAAGEDEKWDCRMRNLHIKIDTGGNSNEYLADVIKFQNEVTCFLKQVGHNIWRFDLICGDFENLTDATVLAKLYKAIYSWLELMPQLKWLSITLSKGTFRTPQPLQEKVKFGRAPKLQNLERFDMAMMTPRVDVMKFYKKILKHNSHIRKFCYVKTINEAVDPLLFQEFLPYALSHLPNLDTLNLANVFHGGHRMFTLGSFMKYNWQLKNLILCLECNYGYVNGVFQFLEKFPTLENVTLKLFGFCVPETTPEQERYHYQRIGFLCLPNLKNFRLILYNDNAEQLCSAEAFRGFFDLRFLLHCTKLRSIEWQTLNFRRNWTIAERMELLEERMIEFGDGRWDLTKSNIWDVFPHLEDVVVRVDKGFCGLGDRSRRIREIIYRNRQVDKLGVELEMFNTQL